MRRPGRHGRGRGRTSAAGGAALVVVAAAALVGAGVAAARGGPGQAEGAADPIRPIPGSPGVGGGRGASDPEAAAGGRAGSDDGGGPEREGERSPTRSRDGLGLPGSSATDAQAASDAAAAGGATPYAPSLSSPGAASTGAGGAGGGPLVGFASGGGPEGGAGAVSTPPLAMSLKIVVLERGTRRPLAGAAISVGAVPVGETDAAGHLTVTLPAGAHQLETQYPGHVSGRDAIQLGAGGKDELIVRLDAQIEGERYETEVRSHHKEVAGVTVDAQEARQTAGTAGDPIRVLASLPGVSQAVWPAALFVVRGSNPGNTGFYIDGIRVPATFHLALGPSIIAPELLQSMDFYPGAYPANFGRYIAGVVSIHTLRPPEDRVHLWADVSLYEARAVATAPVDDGRGVVAVAARYSYTGPLVSLFDQDTTIDYSDYQLRFDHNLWGGQGTILAFGSLDQLDWTIPATPPSMPDPVTQVAALQFHRLDFRWSGAVLGGRLTAGLTGGYDHAQSSLPQAPLTVGSVGVAPRLMWSRRLGRAFDLQVGADAEYQHFEAHPLSFKGKPSDLGRSRPALSQGTFATVRFHPDDRLVISPGVRGDLFVEEGTSRFVVEPRLDMQVDLTRWLGLTLNLGRFSQMPSLPVNVAGFESFGLSSIGLQRSDAISGGASVRAPDDTTVEVVGFYQRMRVTDVSDLDYQSGNVTGDDYLILHDGVGYGVQTMIRRPASHRFSGWLSYTLSWSVRNGSNGVVRSDWDQRHILNLVGAYRVGAGFTVGARVHFNTGRELAVPPPPNTMRIQAMRIQAPNYYQLDLRAERAFVFDRFIVKVFLDVANVTFNRELVQYVSTKPETTPAYLRLVLPTLGVNAAF